MSQALVWCSVVFLSTPSARRATALDKLSEGGVEISIHALREEGDRCRRERRGAGREISIHALREEGDESSSRSAQSRSDFYPRPPRGGRQRTGRSSLLL